MFSGTKAIATVVATPTGVNEKPTVGEKKEKQFEEILRANRKFLLLEVRAADVVHHTAP